MLKKFEVENFKQFKDNLVFELKAASYEFNPDCVKDGLVKTALIYGKNGSGKSNLGWAIFDIIEHLTDHAKNIMARQHYLNTSSEQKTAKFTYHFYINKMDVDYSYEKDESRKLTNEKLKINDKIVISHQSGQLINSTLKGTENLNKKLNEGSNLSALKYIENNANLDSRNQLNKTFKLLMKFISEMLFFRSLLDQVAYIGFTNGSSNIYKDILQRKNLKNFESFLNEMGIECKLSRCEDGGEPTIGFNLHGKIIPISAIASTGTKNLVLFYYWWQQIKDNKVSFLFIDEFDAFYHFKLSNAIVKRLKQLDTQVILTTHNTALLSNELIRPDCGFILDGITIKSLDQGTEKELRNAHNLEKLYRAGLFTGESNG